MVGESLDALLGGAESVEALAAAERGAPAAGEPDEPNRGAPADATSRPRGEAVWKSVPGTTGGFGCERATFYRETVRDRRGYRLSFGADEPIIFGTAIDAAHEYLMADRLTEGPADASLIGFDLSDAGTGEPLTEEHVRELAGSAVRRGVEKARARRGGTRTLWTQADWRLLAEGVGLAVEKLLGLWPNRVEEKASGERRVIAEPEGTPAGPPIGWLDPEPDVMTEAQRSIFVPDVVGGRGLSGRPDYVFVRDGVIVGWLDVKALSKAPSYPAKWASGDTVIYDLMVTHENGGALPEWHGYLEYRRNVKPYWAIVRQPVAPTSIRLAEAYLARWGAALDAGDPDNLAFNPRACAKCDYREALYDRGIRLHEGCPIGPAAVTIAGEADPYEG